MDKIVLKAYGKINLSLDVIRRRPDGYHDVKMIMQTVNVYDTLTMAKREDESISIETDLPGLTCGEDNLVYKAIKLIKDAYSINEGVEVYLEKNIPMAAGMAGGSSDCAAALKGMNILFDLNLSDKELMEYGVKLGADVPYCIMGGTALSEGIGEILTPVNHLKGVKVVIATPNVSVSTPWAYKSLVLDEKTVHPNTEIMLEAVANNDIDKLAKNAYNVLETVVAKEYKEIGALEETMCEKGALGSIMSGSGPTVFGIFDDEEKAESACKEIKEKNHCRCCYLTEFI
ncbi:MAG: 4-(cytidine 5'-diphospho)-2-C-methyl-D-erythritol kinase [Lachnospiraceae bacterium]|nr:4-(cytidine 5'-diphospho)-2-C-methyl-D-erythritol kinase [Lachnospiraceae bacterium]